MLSRDEVEKIKKGMQVIRFERPDATLKQITDMFNYVFGKDLLASDRIEAEKLIEAEFTKNLN